MLIIPILIALISIIVFYKTTNPEISKFQKYILTFLRFLSVSIVIILLFNPILRFKTKKTLIKKTLVLYDISESMDSMLSDTPKKDFFKNILNNLMNKKIEIINFANGISDDKRSTNLAKTIKEIKKKYNYDSIKNIILLSDGQFNDENLDFLKNIPFPIYTFFPKVNDDKINLKISDLKYNREGFTKEEIPFVVTVISHNYKKNATVKLYINDNEKISKTVNFSKRNSAEISFSQSFKKEGLYKIKVELSTPENIVETSYDDNIKIGAIRILKSKINILVISDILNWDYKFFTRALKTNQHWKIHNITYQRDFFEARKSINLEDKFQNISNLIIINNGKLHFKKSQIELIRKFIEQGGGILFMGKPLFDFLPVTGNNFLSEEKAGILITEKGKDYITFDWDSPNIPPMRYYYVNPKVNSIILAEFSNQERSPAILMNTKGLGKIVYFSFFDFWRWQMWDENDKYTKFMINLTKWLNTGKFNRFILTTPKTGYFAGEEINIKLYATDEKLSPLQNLDIKIIIKNEQGEIIDKSFFLENEENYYYKANIFKPGKYKISAFYKNREIASTDFIVYNKTSEKFDSGFNIINLKYIASLTGGKSFFISNKKIGDVVSELTKPSKAKAVIIFKEIPLYKKTYLVLIFLISFILELYLRKRWGLL